MRIIKSIVILLLIFSFRMVEAVNINNPAPGFFISYEDNSFGGVLVNFIRLFLTIVGLISMVYIMIGGLTYITARGDEEKSSSGKKTMSNAIIGLVIVILSYVIVAVVINALKPGGGV